MAATDYPVGHPLAVKLWSRKLAREALKATMAYKFMGESSNFLIQVFDETRKSAGDRIRIPLRMQFTSRGVTENEQLEGNEDTLTTHSDDLLINELNNAARVKTRIDAQRVPFSVREEARLGIQDWYSDRIDTAAANALTGNTAVTDTIYTGFNATTAPTSATGNRRIIYADEASTTEGSLSASQTFQLTMLDTAVQIAKTSTPKIRPIKVGSQEYYVVFLHPNQVRSLRTATNTGSWLDIQKQAMAGGEIEENPIFTGALGVYNGIVLHEWVRLPKAPANANTRRAVFCGAQAAAWAYGKNTGEEPNYVEDTFDYGREFGVSVQTILGCKKLVFNSIDFSTIVITTWAADL